MTSRSNILFREIVSSRQMNIAVLVIAMIFMGLIIGQLILFVTTAFLLMIKGILVISLLAINYGFKKLVITITEKQLAVRFAFHTKRLDLDDIVKIGIDKAHIARYGGFGWRFTRIAGRNAQMFSIIGPARVWVDHGRNKRFVFSTNRPEDIVALIGSRMKGGE